MPPSHDPAPPGAARAAVKRELLVRYLDAWAPAALHAVREASYVDGYADEASVEAALRAFGEFSDLLARHRLTLLAVPADPARATALSARLGVVLREISAPPGLQARVLTGPPDEEIPTALPAGGATLAYLDSAGRQPPQLRTLAAVLAGGRGEALVTLDRAVLAEVWPALNPADTGERLVDDAGGQAAADGYAGKSYPGLVEAYRAALRRSGAALVSHVELVDAAGGTELVCFATSSVRNLERFKDELWAVDEYAGVRYRDPRDPGDALLDISLSPHPGPLRRALMRRLADTGCTVAELRRFAITDTVYRANDVTRVLNALLAAGVVTRDPARGRLTADTRVALAA
jgi:hypothetical protein